jgi:hypothetical protein
LTVLNFVISLPEIQQELRNAIQHAEDELRKLPKAPSDDPSLEIITMLHEFANDLSKHVEGIPDETGLLQLVRPHQNQFRLSIRKTAPNFRPYERKYRHDRHLKSSTFLHNEGEEDRASDDETYNTLPTAIFDGGVSVSGSEDDEEQTPHGAVSSVQEVLFVDDVFKLAEW